MADGSLGAKIVVAEASAIVRSGLAAVLKRIPNLNARPVEVSTPEALHSYVRLHPADILVINPAFGGRFDLPAFRSACGKPRMKYVALLCTVIDSNTLRAYDGHIAVCDTPDTIASTISHLLHTRDEEDGVSASGQEDTLSQREKEIITCIVKGMANKAIADKLCISIHTVITHRRNIARKLQIHSPAGLTIYAIVNKLVELGDIKDTL